MCAKEEIIAKFQTAISQEMRFVRENNKLNINEKMDEIDVSMNMSKFLKDYDENIKVLNKWRINHIYEWKAQYHKMKIITQIDL